jgi:hypothetical protein
VAADERPSDGAAARRFVIQEEASVPVAAAPGDRLAADAGRAAVAQAMRARMREAPVAVVAWAAGEAPVLPVWATEVAAVVVARVAGEAPVLPVRATEVAAVVLARAAAEAPVRTVPATHVLAAVLARVVVPVSGMGPEAGGELDARPGGGWRRGTEHQHDDDAGGEGDGYGHGRVLRVGTGRGMSGCACGHEPALNPRLHDSIARVTAASGGSRSSLNPSRRW